MNRLRAKLRSRRGASITFALLLFLVCSMVSVVVIVAASTAGGRMSSIREMDERYYAVTAVEQRLCALFDGKSAIVNYKKAADGTVTVQSTNPSDKLVGQASAVLFTEGALPTIGDLTYNDTDRNVTYTCTVVGQVTSANLLDFTVQATATGGDSTGANTLVVTFAPTVKETTDAATGVNRAVVTWKLNKIEKRDSAPTGG